LHPVADGIDIYSRSEEDITANHDDGRKSLDFKKPVETK
jgi:hypothetical protein